MQVGAFSLLFQNVSVNPGGILKILSLDCFAVFLVCDMCETTSGNCKNGFLRLQKLFIRKCCELNENEVMLKLKL